VENFAGHPTRPKNGGLTAGRSRHIFNLWVE
jgi:hypothetical protein